MSMLRHTIMALTLTIGLAGCTSEEEIWKAQLNDESTQTGLAIQRLGKSINSGLVSNSAKLKIYAEEARKLRPDMNRLIDELEKDATTSGPIYKSLQARFSNANNDVSSAPAAGANKVNAVIGEFRSIREASSNNLYDMMLTDPINVLADMSDGKLPRVEALSKEAAQMLNESGEMASGHQMVGNPHYGRWRTNSSGTSFWEFYGQYSLMRNLFGYGRPIYYDSWSAHRPYSYYHDYGRPVYTSPEQKTAQNTVQKKTESKFKKSGKSFSSPYAKKRATTPGVARKTSATRKSFKSSLAKSSGSIRNSSSRTSRSSRGGK